MQVETWYNTHMKNLAPLGFAAAALSMTVLFMSPVPPPKPEEMVTSKVYIEEVKMPIVIATTPELTTSSTTYPVKPPCAPAIAAGIMRDVVIAQAAAGLWAPHGITEPDHIRGLRVSCAFGDVARGEPAIKIDWDFSSTRLAGLVVESNKEGSN